MNKANAKSKYPKPDWAIDQIIRASGLVEDICEHGVGHPNRTWLAIHDPGNKHCFGIHGCDGCCSKPHKQYSDIPETE